MKEKSAFPVVSGNWGNDSFKVKNRCVLIQNGKAFYNLPLHCPGSRTLILAGSRPMALLYNSNVLPEKNVKFGELAIKLAVNNRRVKWLHEFDTITTTYGIGRVSYSIQDNQLKGLLVHLEIVPLVNAEGVLLKLRIRRTAPHKHKIKLGWIYGGMISRPDIYCPWDTGQRGKIYPQAEDCRQNQYKIKKDGFYLTRKGSQDVVVSGKASYPGDYQICEAIPGKKGYPVASHMADIFTEDRKTFEGNIAVVWGKRDSVELVVDKVIDSCSKEYQDSRSYSENIENSVRIKTPDKVLDAGVRYTNYSADACWRPPSFLHSSGTWSNWYTGWRDLYGPTVCGWHDRVRSALSFQSQHTSSPDKYPRDEKMDRLENAYIDPAMRATGRIHMATSPITGVTAGHHDCDQLFVDFLYHHFCWTADTELVRELWPVLAQAVEWQKIARDPDDDGLYVNVLNTWISDSHEYHQGACTVQSAYLWKNNLEMAEMARVLGKDHRPYELEAGKIKKAMMGNLWMKEKGIFAEYRDVLGMLHPSPESTSIYHPIEFGLTDMFQSYCMLKYMRENLLTEDGLVSPSQWLPSGRCCHKTPFVCETLNMALAAYCISENELALRMLQASFNTYDKEGIVRSNFYIPLNPQSDTGNMDMLDNASLFQRVIVEGLFGINPQVQKKMVTITPNFPSEWENAGVDTPEIKYTFNKNSKEIIIRLETSLPVVKRVRLPLKEEEVLQVTLNGKRTSFNHTAGIGHYYLEVDIPFGHGEDKIVVKYRSRPIALKYRRVYTRSGLIRIEGSGCKILEVIDHQKCIAKPKKSTNKKLFEGKLTSRTGKYVIFVKIETHNRIFYEPVEFEIKEPLEITSAQFFNKKDIDHTYSLRLVNNSGDTKKIDSVLKLYTQTNDLRLTVKPFRNYEVKTNIGRGTINFLSPGKNKIFIDSKADRLEKAIEITDWQIASKFPGLIPELKKRSVCIPLNDHCNGRLSDFFGRIPPEVRYGYHVREKGRKVDDSYLKKRIKNGFFDSDMGIRFQLSRGKKDAVYIISKPQKNLFIQGWLTLQGADQFYKIKYPSSVRIPIETKGIDKAYLMFLGSTSWMQSYVPAVCITLGYEKGRKEVMELSNPESFDFFMEHASCNFGQPLTKHIEPYVYKYYQRQEHADIVDIIIDPDRKLKYIQLSVTALDTTMALLGLTLLLKK